MQVIYHTMHYMNKSFNINWIYRYHLYSWSAHILWLVINYSLYITVTKHNHITLPQPSPLNSDLPFHLDCFYPHIWTMTFHCLTWCGTKFLELRLVGVEVDQLKSKSTCPLSLWPWPSLYTALYNLSLIGCYKLQKSPKKKIIMKFTKIIHW